MAELNEWMTSYTNINFPDIDKYLFFKAYAKRDIVINDTITSEDSYIVKRIIDYNEEDDAANIPPKGRKPIRIFIDSNGGDLITTLTISDAIHKSKTPIIGINIGKAFSGAAVIYTACHKRFAYPSSTFLFHLGDGAISGTYQQTKAHQKHYDYLVHRMIEVITDDLHLDEEKAKIFKEEMENEHWIYTSPMSDCEDIHTAAFWGLIDNEE